jgi:hypothetical protein
MGYTLFLTITAQRTRPWAFTADMLCFGSGTRWESARMSRLEMWSSFLQALDTKTWEAARTFTLSGDIQLDRSLIFCVATRDSAPPLMIVSPPSLYQLRIRYAVPMARWSSFGTSDGNAPQPP